MSTKRNATTGPAAAVLVAFSLAGSAVVAQPPAPAGPPPGATASGGSEAAAPAPVREQGPRIDLNALIERVGREIDREFIIDARLPTEVRVASTSQADGDYDTLLALLRINGYIAIETGDQVLILPEAVTRAAASPLLQSDDPRVSDHAIVTRVIDVPPGEEPGDGGPPASSAAQMIPVLRPIASQNAHMAAIASTNQIIVIDHYDNVRRITEIIEELTD